jgi:hypothetical protein
VTTGIIWAQVRKFECFGACVLYLCSYNLVGSVTDLILFFILFMFLVIMFIVYFHYTLSIARLSLCSSIRSYSAHPLNSWVSGRHCVSVVLIHCLPVDAPYIPGHVVDRGCDTLVESFVVHSPNIG